MSSLQAQKVEACQSLLDTAINLLLNDENLDVDEGHIHLALWHLLNQY